MAITVPSQELPGVGSRPLAAPQVQNVGPDRSGDQLFATAANAAAGLAQQAMQHADTAAIMEAEAKLSQHKLDLMFNEQSGVYSRKGKDALDITNQTLPAFDKQAEEIGAGLTTARQKEQFASIVNHQRQGINQELNRYEFTQRNEYYDQVDKANLATSADGAVKYADDPAQVAYYQSKGAVVIGERARRLGLPPEEVQRQTEEFNSGIAVNVIQKMQASDPLRAQQYYAANYQGMTAAAQEQVRNQLGIAVANQAGLNIAQNLMNGNGTLGQAGLPDLIMHAESGGNQTRSDGSPVMSPKGATGAMQLMPETAMEVSKQLGIPFDLGRLGSDKQYNMALGTQYINNMLGKYGGNKTLAVAAYNAGPGSVDKWIKKYGDPRSGEISEAEFIEKIPFAETRNYTAGIIGKMSSATPPKDESFESRYAAGLKSLANITDPRVKKVAESALEDFKKAHNAEVGANYDSAAEYVLKGGIASVPPQLLTSLPADEQIKLQKMDDYQRKGQEPRTDYDKFQGFLTMPPEKLAQLSLGKDVQPYLNKADFNVIREAWQKAAGGDETVQKVAKAKEDAITRGMQMVGIVTGESKDAVEPSNLRKQDLFRANLQSLQDSFQSKNGRKPDVEEVTSMANQLAMKVRLTGGGIFGTDTTKEAWQVEPQDLGKITVSGNLKLADVPPSDRRQIIATLRANKQDVSEASIIAYYTNRISQLGTKVK